MTDAPARIHLDGDSEAGQGMFPRCFENPKYCGEPAIEYVRADLVEALEDENQRLREALLALVTLNDEWAPFGGELYQDRVNRVWDAARAALRSTREGG